MDYIILIDVLNRNLETFHAYLYQFCIFTILITEDSYNETDNKTKAGCCYDTKRI